MADVRRLFSTPLALEMIDDPPLIDQLRGAIAEERARDPQGVARSNVGGWHSNIEMLDWGGEPARRLAEITMRLADTLTVDRLSHDESRFGWRSHMWANVSARGHANQYHIHPGCFWSAVFYVDDGYAGSVDPSLGGELQLQDPRMAVRVSGLELATRDSDGTTQFADLALRPKTGLLVLFPSWLEHAVRAFNNDGERIAVALNLIAVLKPPLGG
jgi:uncharacterized protein (TIGR02466 family)